MVQVFRSVWKPLTLGFIYTYTNARALVHTCVCEHKLAHNFQTHNRLILHTHMQVHTQTSKACATCLWPSHRPRS